MVCIFGNDDAHRHLEVPTKLLQIYQVCYWSTSETRLTILAHTVFSRTEFRNHISIDKKDFPTIEYLLRKGQRQVDIYKSPQIKDIHR